MRVCDFARSKAQLSGNGHSLSRAATQLRVKWRTPEGATIKVHGIFKKHLIIEKPQNSLDK